MSRCNNNQMMSHGANPGAGATYELLQISFLGKEYSPLNCMHVFLQLSVYSLVGNLTIQIKRNNQGKSYHVFSHTLWSGFQFISRLRIWQRPTRKPQNLEMASSLSGVAHCLIHKSTYRNTTDCLIIKHLTQITLITLTSTKINNTDILVVKFKYQQRIQLNEVKFYFIRFTTMFIPIM